MHLFDTHCVRSPQDKTKGMMYQAGSERENKRGDPLPWFPRVTIEQQLYGSIHGVGHL